MGTNKTSTESRFSHLSCRSDNLWAKVTLVSQYLNMASEQNRSDKYVKRITLFKIPKEEDIEATIEQYKVLRSTAVKVSNYRIAIVFLLTSQRTANHTSSTTKPGGQSTHQSRDHRVTLFAHRLYSPVWTMWSTTTISVRHTRSSRYSLPRGEQL